MSQVAFDFYTEAKGWQTVIGSAFGFLALIAGALFNAWLNRRRDDRLREQEARSVMLALYSEIAFLRADVAQAANMIGERAIDRIHEENQFPGSYVSLFRLPEPHLYKELADKLGLLPERILSGTVEFYRNYEEARVSLPLIIDDPDNKTSKSPSWFTVPAVKAARDVHDVLGEIATACRVKRVSEMPKLKGADDYAEFLESMYGD